MNLRYPLVIGVALGCISCASITGTKNTATASVPSDSEKMQQSMLEPVPFIDRNAVARPPLDADDETVNKYVQYLYDVSV